MNDKPLMDRPEMIPKPNKNRDMPLTPIRNTPRPQNRAYRGQKIPENDTEKIQFSRPIRDTHGNGRKERTNATHEQQTAA